MPKWTKFDGDKWWSNQDEQLGHVASFSTSQRTPKSEFGSGSYDQKRKVDAADSGRAVRTGSKARVHGVP